MPLSSLKSSLGSAALFCDFDGTLSEIVTDPADAQPIIGIPDLLSRLAADLAVMCIVSGRSVDFLERLFPDPRIELAGLYGIERRHLGQRVDHPDSEEWRHEVAAAVAISSKLPAGVVVESKGLSLTAHYRTVPEAGPIVYAWALETAMVTGLDVRPAKLSYELHPPVEVDKGVIVCELADACPVVAFVGDDVGDLPAYEALGRMREGGRTTVSVVVRGPETPPVLLTHADVVVEGPIGATKLLRSLLT